MKDRNEMDADEFLRQQWESDPDEADETWEDTDDWKEVCDETES